MAQFRPSWLLYGASGFSGALIAEFAKSRGFEPILAGRSADKLRPLADRLGLKFRAFELNNAAELDKSLMGVKLVLNCAGPFDHTGTPLASGCIRNSVHYLDISGEVNPIRALSRLHERAREERVMLLPGVGFGCLPSEALLAHIKQQRPGVVSTQLAIALDGGISRGTLDSLAQSLRLPGYSLDRGQLHAAKAGEHRMEVDFGAGGKRRCGINPWRGDLLTAHMGLGYSHLQCFTDFPWYGYRLFANPDITDGQGLLGKLYKFAYQRMPSGPIAAKRALAKSFIWAEGVDEDGRKAGGLITGPDAYDVTAHCAMYAVEQVLGGKQSDGFTTCGALFGVAPLNAIKSLSFKPISAA
jgi:short subunit dehydrogenase-like uncharacterized protein